MEYGGYTPHKELGSLYRKGSSNNLYVSESEGLDDGPFDVKLFYEPTKHVWNLKLLVTKLWREDEDRY